MRSICSGGLGRLRLEITRLTRVAGPVAALAAAPLAGVTATAQQAAPDPFEQDAFARSTYVSGLSTPTAMAFAPDGRLFVTEQRGRLRVVDQGRLLSRAFVKLGVDSNGERGLLGVAFHPAFPAAPYVYVYYTSPTPYVHNRISRFRADGNVAVAGSEEVLLDLDPLSSATNHNGGALHFGADGKLYAGVGENANPSNAQTLTNLLGKILRINANGTVPPDNPFIGQAQGKNRAIWALGLRNPFTFDVQPGTGRIYINDVGQDTWEEIDRGGAGVNFGWPVHEGPENDPRYRPPLYAYDHGQGCAIAGGAFYNPLQPQFPDRYRGDYFFADLCGGWVRRYNADNRAVTTVLIDLAAPVDLKVGPDGLLYVLERGTGSVTKVRFVSP